MREIKVEENFKQELLEKRRWFKVVRRDNSALAFSLTAVGPVFRNKGLEFNSEVSNYLRLAADVYGSVDGIEQLKERMLSLYSKDILFLKRYFLQAESDCKEYLLFVNSISNKNLKDLNRQGLRDLFEEYIERSCRVMSHIWPPIAIQDWLVDEIKKELRVFVPQRRATQFNKVLQGLIAPEQLSNTQKKKEAILKIAVKIKGNSSSMSRGVKKEIERAYDKFAWVTDHSLKLKYESLDSFFEEIKKEAQGDPKKKLATEQQRRKQAKKDKAGAIQKYKLSKKLIMLSQAASLLPYIRFLRLEVLFEGGYRLREFFAKITKEIGIENISDLYFWETIAALAGGKLNLAEIKKRNKGSGLLVLNKKVWIFGLEDVIKARNKIEAVTGFKGELKGASACLGYAEGKARVLFAPKDIVKVQRGDILVTSMTTPEFVTAMEKASAFVTDEGGISCHAAIESREMNKPCVVGTKIATKVLKDGDIVEVDANKGIVKIKESAGQKN